MPRAAKIYSALPFLLGLVVFPLPRMQAQAAPVDPKTITEIDAGLGPCTADFTVNDPSGQPVYNAKIRLHIEYGRLNLHKLDLEAGTNTAGKARFIGLPEKSKQGLFFRASAGAHETAVFYNPAQSCKKDFTVTVDKKSPKDSK